MKKLLLVVLSMLMSISAFALEIGTEAEFIINKNISLKNLNVDADYSAQYYDITTDINLGAVTISPKAGLNTFSLDAEIPFVGDAEANGGIGFNVGLDAEVRVLKTKYADLDLIGSYRYARTDVDEIDLGGVVTDNPFETILTTHEWETGIKVSKDLTDIAGIALTPYVGLVYSDLKGDIDVNLPFLDAEENLSANDNIGIRTGFSIDPVTDLNINIGLKLVDETAITGALSYRF